MAKQVWQNREDEEKHPKCWYEPIVDPFHAEDALSCREPAAALGWIGAYFFRLSLACFTELYLRGFLVGKNQPKGMYYSRDASKYSKNDINP